MERDFSLGKCPAIPGELQRREPPIPGIPGQREELPPIAAMTATADGREILLSGGGMEVSVRTDAFGFQVRSQKSGKTLLKTASAGAGFAPLAHTRNEGAWNLFLAWWQYEGFDRPWQQAARVSAACLGADRAYFTLQGAASRFLFVVGPFYEGALRLAAAAVAEGERPNRLAMTFAAPPEERYVGFGERFNSIDQRGRVLWNWAEEGGINPGDMKEILAPGTAEEFAYPGGETTSYAPMPFFISNQGYGFLAEVPHPTHFDLASTHREVWRLTAEADALSLVVFDGPTPAEVLYRYTERTGRSQVPRRWMLAPWNMFVGYSQGNYLTVARLFREKDIPSSVTHEWTAILPTGSHRGREQSLKANNAKLHGLGYRVLSYLQSRVDYNRYRPLWDEADGAGYFVRDKAGDSYLIKLTLNAMTATEFLISFIDFTREGVEAWWHRLLQAGLDLGYDGWMYDFGEYIPPDSVFADGQSGHYWHNAYPLIYQRAGFRFAQKLDDDPDDGLAPDYLYFVRSGYPGSQNWTYAMWGGDPEADWSVSDGLPASVLGGLNAGLSGMPVWGSDIGGFHGIFVPAPTSELLKRWMQFGAFSGLMRDMTAAQIRNGSRIHVLDEEEVTFIVRKYQKLRTQLVPYIFNAAWEARRTGLPLMRAPLLHHPGDPRVWEIKRSYYFGPDLYVAPVIVEGARERKLYLPRGEWIEFWKKSEYDGTMAGGGMGGFRIGGHPIQGGREITVSAPLDQIPLFIRLGAAIPLVDPTVDTFSGAAPPAGIPVTTSKEKAHLLHLWTIPDGTTTTTLDDRSELTVTAHATGVRLTRAAAPDQKELVAQVIWPANLAPPRAVSQLTEVPNADPLTLPPGTWTWSQHRNALALHGRPGQLRFELTIQ